MISRKLALLGATAVLIAGGTAFPVAAADVAGMVLEVSGKTDPAVTPFSELTQDQVIKLDAGATLKVVHYKACRTVSLEGGTLKVGAADLDVSAAKVEDDAKGACPRKVARNAKAGESGIGGILLRGNGDPPIAVSPGETFVLASDTVGHVERVRFMIAEKVVAEWVPGTGRSWELPSNALKLGDLAVMEIKTKDSATPLQQSIKMLKPIGDDKKVTLIDVN